MSAVIESERRTLLLVEPQFVMRRTVAMVAQELRVARIREATNYEAALRMLNEARFDGMLIDMGDAMTCLNVLQQIRSGGTHSETTLPVALMAETCDPGTIAMFRDMQVCRIMLKPFKVKTAVEVLSVISGVPIPA